MLFRKGQRLSEPTNTDTIEKHSKQLATQFGCQLLAKKSSGA